MKRTKNKPLAKITFHEDYTSVEIDITDALKTALRELAKEQAEKNDETRDQSN